MGQCRVGGRKTDTGVPLPNSNFNLTRPTSSPRNGTCIGAWDPRPSLGKTEVACSANVDVQRKLLSRITGSFLDGQHGADAAQGLESRAQDT